MPDLGTIGYGTALGRSVGGVNSYPANEKRVGGTPLGSYAVSLVNPYVRKPNGYKRDFIIQNVAGGSAVPGSLAYIREHYSQEQLGTGRAANASGAVTFRNLDSTAVYTITFIHPSSSSFNAAVADWIVPNPGT